MVGTAAIGVVVSRANGPIKPTCLGRGVTNPGLILALEYACLSRKQAQRPEMGSVSNRLYASGEFVRVAITGRQRGRQALLDLPVS